MDSRNHHTSSELEGVPMVESVLSLEGDLGDLVINNTAVSIEKLI